MQLETVELMVTAGKDMRNEAGAAMQKTTAKKPARAK